MATYAIGDIQGCYKSLKALLQKIHFRPSVDKLCLVGDLVNRGPRSLETLQYLADFGDCVQAVLGNHDIHVIALFDGAALSLGSLEALLNHCDAAELVTWLRQFPLVDYVDQDHESGYLMVHAGIPPIWSDSQACQFSAEVSQALSQKQTPIFYQKLYGNQPDRWSDSLSGQDRLRLITNYCTRMRFCDQNGLLELASKGTANNPPLGYQPWFSHASKLAAGMQVLFGHWAALSGKTTNDWAIALDTGCVWGKQLTAYRLEDKRFFSVSNQDS